MFRFFGGVKRMLGSHFDEFISRQTELTRARVKLLCVLSVGAYFFASLATYLIEPGSMMPEDVLIGILLVSGALILFRINSSLRSLRSIKINAYVFTVFLLALLFKLAAFYVVEQPNAMDSALVFLLFLIAMTIPWFPEEVFVIGAMVGAAYTVFYLYVRFSIGGETAAAFSLREFLDGLMFLLLSFILCVVVRRNESEGDARDFILMKKVEENNEKMKRELELAMRIHKTLIPASVNNDNADIAVSYLPVSYVGGDYAKFHFLDNDKLIFIISDVTGHGVPAALLVNRIHAEFERLAKEGKGPGELMEELNTFIKQDFEGTDMYLSAFCGLMDFRKMMMKYSNHGHPPQCVYHLSGSFVQELPAQTAMLGLPMEDAEVYQDEIKLGAGDRILLFTDGVTEAASKSGEMYGESRLEGFFRDNHALIPEDFNQRLLMDLEAFSGAENFKDDIFILNIALKAHHGLFHLGR